MFVNCHHVSLTENNMVASVVKNLYIRKRVQYKEIDKYLCNYLYSTNLYLDTNKHPHATLMIQINTLMVVFFFSN